MKSACLFLRNQKPGGFFFLLFCAMLFSCTDSSKGNDASVTDSTITQTIFTPVEISEEQIHRYLADREMEGGQGEFILEITGKYELDKNKIVAFSDSNDYFGDKINGMLLADASGKITDAYFFTADSFKIKNSFRDFFDVTAGNGNASVDLKYTILHADDAGEHYLDSIEKQYWEMHKELARPNENRFQFSDVPASYIDTLQIKKSFHIISGKFRPF